MKHAGDAALDTVEDLLIAVRRHEQLKEKKRGTFYRRGSGFLHFHEDPAGMFADLKIADDFERFPVNTAAERQRFLARVADAIKREPPR
jgi:hypothetical protein